MGRQGQTRRAAGALVATLAALAGPAAAMANPFSSPGAIGDAQSGGGALGRSASISADGTVAVIGEPDYAGGAGAALVYTHSDGSWTFVQRLTPSGETGAGHFGASVSVDGSGQTLVVGAPDDNGGVGAAWAFALEDGTWTQQGQLLGRAAETGAGRFGASVAVANGGLIALVGAPLSDAGMGQALTFYYDSLDGWYLFQHMNRAAVPAGSHFGASVALSNNGSSGWVGAPNAGSGDGALYAYTHWLGSPYWIEPAEGIPSPSTGGGFGASLALSRGGDYAVAGAPLAGGGDGAAYEYTLSGSRVATFADPAPDGGHFGASVALAGATMDQVLVGAPGDTSGTGAAFDFDISGADPAGSPLAPAAAQVAGDAYGSAVAVSADASVALAGAPGTAGGDGSIVHFLSRAITVPDPPVSVQALAGVRSASVSWGTPLSTGGSPITGYTATSSPDGAHCQTATFFGCTVLGLTAGQPYTFTVTATNSRGESRPSAPSDPVTPTGDTDGGSGGSGGGSPGDGGTGTGGGGGDPATPAPPPPGTGPATTAATAPPAAPSRPLKAKLARTSITLVWGPSANAAAYRVYEYVRRGWRLVATTPATRRTYTRRRLRPRSRHRFEVRAVGAGGSLSLPLVGRWLTTR